MRVCAKWGLLQKTQNPCLFALLCSSSIFFLLTESLFNSVFFLGEAVPALMAVKIKLKDELNVMNGWDINSVDPCTWITIACSTEGFVVSL